MVSFYLMNASIKQYLSENGKKGGNTTKMRYGMDHYKTIGKMGGRPKKVKNEAILPIDKVS